MTLEEVKYTFFQEGNNLGTTSFKEKIEIKLNFQIDLEPFFVISTEGWSFDSSKELKDMIDCIVEGHKVFSEKFDKFIEETPDI